MARMRSVVGETCSSAMMGVEGRRFGLGGEVLATRGVARLSLGWAGGGGTDAPSWWCGEGTELLRGLRIQSRE